MIKPFTIFDINSAKIGDVIQLPHHENCMDKNKVNVLATAKAGPEVRCIRYGQSVPGNRWTESVVLSSTTSGDGDFSSLGSLHANRWGVPVGKKPEGARWRARRRW
jgi:hypothetical protein